MTAKKKLRQHHKPPTRSALARPTGSAFRAWFEAQHGKRPNTGYVSDEKLREMVLLGEWARREMYARQIYDAKKQAALYAWTAKDCSDKEIMRRLPNVQAEPRASSPVG